MFHTFSAVPERSPENVGPSETAKPSSRTASPDDPSSTGKMYHTFSTTTSSGADSAPARPVSPRSPNTSPIAGQKAGPRGRPKIQNREPSGVQVQQTLTVCTRCRQRKIRCDPGLPRCTPCEKANAQCEYFDVTKRQVVSRKYVVWLQHKIQELEVEVAAIEAEDRELDSELAVRNPGLVRLKESEETKFLGPSSGIAISRVVMNLAKQFSDSKSIKQIISEKTAKAVEEKFTEEEAKAVPDQPPIPMYSEAPAVELPSKELTANLVNLFFTKVHAMYPVLHEPTFVRDVDAVFYRGSQDAFQNFALRMVIAVGLQRMDTQFTALADAYYLAALKYLEDVVQLKSLKTLQAYALIAAYSLCTPTRTAIYYVIGAATRLAEALGFTSDSTVSLGENGQPVDALELDMRRRLAWSILVMDFGLAHSLGRPSAMSINREDIDLSFFAIVEDESITPQGILRDAVPSIKKWICVHFFKMRLLQLEIRKALYQKKRPEPIDDSHPWFQHMWKKLVDWRDASPLDDVGTGLDKVWFNGRFNTMVIFLYRPSPQVPKPSTSAALKCYDAVQYNVLMHREQMRRRNVEVTWVFVQSIFMAVNTLLWTLSYEEIRKLHPRSEVQSYLDVGLESILLAAERWPGSASAHQLYMSLIEAILKVYEKDGDIQITPESTFTSPETMRPQSTPTAPWADEGDRVSPLAKPASPSVAPFGYIQKEDYGQPNQAMSPIGLAPITPPGQAMAPPANQQPAPTSVPSAFTSTSTSAPANRLSQPTGQQGILQLPVINAPPTPGSPVLSQKLQSSRTPSQSPNAYENLHYFHPQGLPQPLPYNPDSSYNQLPTTFDELDSWTPSFVLPNVSPNFLMSNPYASNFDTDTSNTSPSFGNPSSSLDVYEFGAQSSSAFLQAQQQPLPSQEYYPDPYWTAEMLTEDVGGGGGGGVSPMHGSGLAADQQAGLMQNLETTGPEQIERMIAESNAFFGSRTSR